MSSASGSASGEVVLRRRMRVSSPGWTRTNNPPVNRRPLPDHAM
jgi:hypothetical protein